MRLTKKLLVMPLALLSAGCQTTVTTPPASCSEFIPSAWAEEQHGADMPQGDSAAEWMAFGVAQTGALVKVHGRLMDTLHIFRECEKRANAARPKRLF